MDLTDLLIQILTLGFTILPPFVPFLIPRSVKKIARISLSKSKVTHLLGNLGKAVIEAVLSVPLVFSLTYLYSPTGLFNVSYLLLALYQSMLLVELALFVPGIFIYERAISYFEEDSARINAKINALSARVNLEPNDEGEESSIQRDIKIEKQYLRSQLLEKRKTIAGVRCGVDKLYPSKKTSKARKLVAFLVPQVPFFGLSLLINLFLGPPFTATLGAIIIGILAGLLLLFVIFKGERMSSRIGSCRAAATTTEIMKEKKKAIKQKQQQTKKK